MDSDLLKPYHLLKKSDLKKAADVFAGAFLDDPLYQCIQADRSKRAACMKYFFRYYLRLMYQSSYILTDSSDMKMLAVVWDPSHSEHHPVYLAKVVWSFLRGLRVIPTIGLSGYVRAVSILTRMTSAWTDQYLSRPFLHLDMFAVQKQFRGQNLGGNFLRAFTGYCKERGLLCTLETQQESNIGLYHHFGFCVTEKMIDTRTRLTEYCMVCEPDSNKIQSLEKQV
ncbi:MAG TPA: GNAT family N-acetyltransferase [Clostridia bacterium]|nr:GNAT family N-acetyltransferase [Clostridia bacterium]